MRRSRCRTTPALPTVACSLFSTPIGVYGDHGVIVLGSARQDFPRDTDRLLVSLAANVSVTVLRKGSLSGHAVA
jgi:hypothetical protein